MPRSLAAEREAGPLARPGPFHLLSTHRARGGATVSAIASCRLLSPPGCWAVVGSIHAPRLRRQVSPLGSLSGKLGHWTRKSTFSLPWEKPRARGLLSDCCTTCTGADSGQSVSRISLPALMSLVSCSPRVQEELFILRSFLDFSQREFAHELMGQRACRGRALPASHSAVLPTSPLDGLVSATDYATSSLRVPSYVWEAHLEPFICIVELYKT